MRSSGQGRRQELSPEQREKLLEGFQKQAVEHAAASDLEANPAQFLESLKTGKYNGMDVEKRLSMGRSANAAISSVITIQKREQEVKKEKADRDIQMLVDANAPADLVQQKLRDLTDAGVYGRDDRKFWEERLIKGETTDTPAQANNSQTLLTDFQSSYPTAQAIKAGRANVDAMLKRGDLGVKGAGQIRAHLNRVEQSIRSEARAEASAARANEPKDMPDTQARRLVASNYRGESITSPTRPQHREDVKEYNERVLGRGEERGKVANEIYTRRKQQLQEAEKRAAERTKASQSDPTSKEIFDRLQQLKGGR